MAGWDTFGGEALKGEEEILLKQLQEDSRWIEKNIKKLRKEFEGKVFAVKRKRVIASDDNIVFLLKQLEKLGVNADDVLIESIPPRDVAFIL
jgi:hypothetical protein